MKINISKKRLAYLYEIMLPILALIALFTLMSLGSSYFNFRRQSFIVFMIDHIIWFIFTADFAVRTCLTENRRHFVTSHLAELIAIIPIAPIVLVAIGLDHLHMQIISNPLLELVFVVKFFSYLLRTFITQRRFIKTNPLHYAAAITMTALVVSAELFSGFEGKNYSDSIWWAFTTASTTGFGDIVPITEGGRIVGIFLMVVGVACISMLTGVIASKLMHDSSSFSRKESSHIINIIKELTHFSELSDGDVDDICAVLKTLKERQDLSKKIIVKPTTTKNKTAKGDWRSKPFAKWARSNFLSNPEDDMLIENKIMEKK